jgi:hypothetical protein
LNSVFAPDEQSDVSMCTKIIVCFKNGIIN